MDNEIKIRPKSRIDAVLDVPGSKSITQRALIIAALSRPSVPSSFTNYLLSDDTEHMMKALQAFGVKFEANSTLLVTPPHRLNYEGNGELRLGNAGTAVRFLTGFCCLGFGQIQLVGDKKMAERPIDDLVESLGKIVEGGSTIMAISRNEDGRACPPVIVNSKGLKGGKTTLKGGTSSQYLTSELLVAPYAKSDVEIEIEGTLTSRPYAEMTIALQKKAGVHVDVLDANHFRIAAGQHYKPINLYIEGDAGSASYHFAAAAATGGRARITNLGKNSIQGELGFVDVLARMGCRIEKGDNYVEVIGPDKLRAVEVDMNTMPDTAVTLAVLASIAEGITRITGISSLKTKESDRIKSLETELQKIGIHVIATNDSLTIYGGNPHGARIDTHGDHRIAMAFSPIGLAVKGIIILNPKEVKKSYPDIYETRCTNGSLLYR